MATNDLDKIAAAPTKVASRSEQYNDLVDAFSGHFVHRDTDGDVADGGHDIGRPNAGRFDNLYLTTGMTIAGQSIDFSSIQLQVTGITSGKAKTSGYPDFLTPFGATGTGTNTFTIEAASTNLIMTIDGTAYVLEADRTSDDLALAPSANNTALVGDSAITSDPEYSKTIGEYGYWIVLDDTGGGGIGSEITSLDGTVQCFKINNGADDEVFIADVDTTNSKLVPILRGIGGTDRIKFSDGDTITLLKAHYIFLDNDLSTIDTTTTYPSWSDAEPSTPATGDYWYKISEQGWYRYSGATWEKLGRIYLGYAICDDSDCLWVEHEHFNLAWNDLAELPAVYNNGVTGIVFDGDIYINVAGTNIRKLQKTTYTVDSNMESGVTFPTYPVGAGLNQWYIYIKPTGEFITTDKAPRPRQAFKGWYHPQEYWRFVTHFYYYNEVGFSQISPFFFSSQSGWHSLDLNNGAGTGTLDITYSPFLFAALPPMATTGLISAIIDWGAGSGEFVKARSLDGSVAIEVQIYIGEDSTSYVKQSSMISFIRNNIIELEATTTAPSSTTVYFDSYYLKI